MQDKEPDYAGLGYGGVTVIVKNNAHFSVKEINIASDRIVAVGIYDKHDKLIQVVCSTYLPYFDSDKSRLAQYVETIDALQSLIDLYAGLAPFKILGDFNAQLPISKKLNKHWYKKKRFQHIQFYPLRLLDTQQPHTCRSTILTKSKIHILLSHKQKIYLDRPYTEQ